MKRDAKPDPSPISQVGPGCILPIVFLPIVVIPWILASGAFATKDFEQIWPVFLIFPLWVAVVFVALWLEIEFSSSRCPDCRKRSALQLVAKDIERTGRTREIQVQVPEEDGYHSYETVTQTQIITTRRWKCKFCGYEKTGDVEDWQ